MIVIGAICVILGFVFATPERPKLWLAVLVGVSLIVLE